MTLKEIAKNIHCEIIGNEETEITGITDIAENVQEGNMFVAIRGMHTDGHTFIPQAIERGASVVVAEKPLPGVKAVQVVVQNTRKAVADFAAAFFGHPAKKLKMIGVTGTNGKTTTTHMINHILNKNGIKCGLIGTSGCFWDGKQINYGMTTPDPIDLQKTLHFMLQDGVKAVAMEVSAHALDLEKTSSIKFDVAVFTNLTRDHLDYFKTMENYKMAKQKLFCRSSCKTAIICTDDQAGKELASLVKTKVICYGKSRTGCQIIRNKNLNNGQEFIMCDNGNVAQFFVPMLGEYNAKNALAAVLACREVGVEFENSKLSLQSLSPVLGRFETFSMQEGGLIIMDYAHSPDGLENLLNAAREIADERGGRLISLFGCGGNRDKGKRPQMGKISEKLADFTIVTSDNPRYENPEEIISEIENGMMPFSHTKVTDRTAAISLGVRLLGQNDVLVVAGKGNENYLDINGVKIPYSDTNAINQAIIASENQGQK